MFAFLVWGPHAVFVRGPRMDILLCESRVMAVGPVLIGEARTLRLVSSKFCGLGGRMGPDGVGG